MAKGYNPKKLGNPCYNIQFASRSGDGLKADITGFVRSTQEACEAATLIQPMTQLK
jgi:hypothetical protein